MSKGVRELFINDIYIILRKDAKIKRLFSL